GHGHQHAGNSTHHVSDTVHGGRRACLTQSPCTPWRLGRVGDVGPGRRTASGRRCWKRWTSIALIGEPLARFLKTRQEFLSSPGVSFAVTESAMSNSKTIPSPPKPVPQSGWVHKCDLDDYLDRHLPIPTQVVSNEEYYPLPHTTKQKAVELHLLDMAENNARKLGMERRQFLRSACAMATAFAAMNEVFGYYFRVQAPEM